MEIRNAPSKQPKAASPNFCSRVLDWIRTRAQDPTIKNRLAFIYHCNSRQELADKIREQRFDILGNFLNGRREGDNIIPSNVIRVGEPDAQECRNLILRERLLRSADCHLGEIDTIARTMSVNEEIVSLEGWRSNLGELFKNGRIRSFSIAALRGTLPGLTEKLALARLDELIGLETLKREIRKEILRQKEYDRQGMRPNAGLHLCITGNPGTGKTEVARLIGEIYRDEGILKRGHLTEVRNTGDIVSDVVGGTATRVNELFDRARGGVLFIDEAYALADKERGQFGQEAIDAMMNRMETERREICVILAGYPNRMDTFLRANPGMESRISRRIRIENYTVDELNRIFTAMLSKRLIPRITEEAAQAVRTTISGWHRSESNLETWSNARNVRNLLDRMEENCIERCASSPKAETVLSVEDIPADLSIFWNRTLDTLDIDRELGQLVGLAGVKSFIRDLFRETAADNKRRDLGFQTPTQNPHRMRHMLFVGNPGTGKTTVAKLMGGIFHRMKVLPKDQVIVVNATSLTGEYVGEAPAILERKFKEAMGGILFIDEIYALAGGSFGDTYGKDIVNSLQVLMTDHAAQICVIGAGYQSEVERFKTMNLGLYRRFTREILFEDYSADELLQILLRHGDEHGYLFTPEAVEKAARYLGRVFERRTEGFGNAGYVKNELFAALRQRLDQRCLDRESKEALSKEEWITFREEDIPDFD